jgi:hypothetical protein
MWALHRFGVRQVDSVMARAALVADEGEATPEWVLHVGAVTDAQVRAALVTDEGEAPPELVLHIGAVTDAQVHK